MVLVVLVRLPFLYNSGVDEAFYLVVGRQWLDGVPPYAGSFDVKPPLLFGLMAAAEWLFGQNLLAAKALDMAAVAATACGLYMFGRRFTGELAGIAAAVFYIVSTLTLGGTFSPAELLMAPFTTFGVLIGLPAALDRTRPRVPALITAGLCLGAAASIKQTAIFEAVPLALALLWGRSLAKGLQALGTFAAGCCIVPALFALYFLATGHLHALIADVAVSAAGRMNAGYVPWSDAFLRLLFELTLVLPVVIMAGLLWVNRRAFRSGPAYPALKFLAAWTAAALLGVIAGRAMCEFYALTVLQPLCLAAGAYAQYALGSLPNPRRQWIAGLAMVAVVAFYSVSSVAPLVFAGGSGLRAAEAAAALMRQAGQCAGDRIMVVDRDVILYLAAGADPPTPVFHPLQLLCEFPFAGAAAAVSDSLDRRPAFVAVADPALLLDCEMPGRRPMLEARLARDYRLLGRFSSTVTSFKPGSFAVYALMNRVAGC
jgi:4-amino-4-deoxy-L-arabinose transferase-like glycosyltransferase